MNSERGATPICRWNDSEVVFLAVHVPKCAGRTIEAHMVKHLPAEQRWQTLRRPLAARAWGCAAPELSNVRFISGHHLGRSIEQHLGRRTLKRSVLLREPTSFLVSYYNYRIMRYLSQGWNSYGFELHLRSLPCDPISHFLLQRWLEIPWPTLMAMSPDRKYDLLNQELSRFWYVADYKYCDELIELMARKLGIPTKAELRNTKEEWTKKVEWRPLSADDLSPSIHREIMARTRLDKALWQSWGQARLDTSGVKAVPLESYSPWTFPIAEMTRPVHAFARRYQRGWF